MKNREELSKRIKPVWRGGRERGRGGEREKGKTVWITRMCTRYYVLKVHHSFVQKWVRVRFRHCLHGNTLHPKGTL